VDEVELVAALRPDVPSAAHHLGSARDLLLAAISLDESAEHAGALRRPGHGRVRGQRREARSLGVRSTMVVAVTVAAVFLAIANIFGGSHDPSGDVSPGFRPGAVGFLHRVADAAKRQSAFVPQVGGYTYSEIESPTGTITREWLSVYGARTGLMTKTSSGGVSKEYWLPPCTAFDAMTTGCSPSVGHYPNMPTHPHAALLYLESIGVVSSLSDAPAQSAADRGWYDNALARSLSGLLETSTLTPAQRAALYDLLAETPGFRLVPHFADAIGRLGVGIEWRFKGGSGALIFNPTTYALLGIRTWPAGQSPNPGAPYEGNALLVRSVVATIGPTP
jgi:hypothetical protein